MTEVDLILVSMKIPKSIWKVDLEQNDNNQETMCKFLLCRFFNFLSTNS